MLYAGVLRVDPQNFAHIAAKCTCGLVNELAHFAHTPFWMCDLVRRLVDYFL
jgi:hypothetical protein